MRSPEVLVVGGGPGGSAAAYWLARAGHDVLVVEKKEYPREKTCGDALTPRAIHELTEMGFDFDRPELHRTHGLRAYAGSRKMELRWPEHPVFPSWGGVIRRADLDGQVAELAEKQGVVVRSGTEAVPTLAAGGIDTVELHEAGEVEVIQPRIVVVADGSLSRFGRRLGAYRRRDYPYGLGLRGYFASPRSDDGFLESHLDIRDAEGRSIPGYGWVFPLGDGTVNIGVGVLSTFKAFREVNTTDLLAALVDQLPGHWEITPDNATSQPTGGKLPMSFSVGPKAGRNWVLVGDAAGAINPFNGEGIDYAYETGRMAAGFISPALAGDDPGLLQGYPQALEDAYGDYFRVARAFVRAIGHPVAMRTLVRTGMRFRPVMEWTLRVMANLLAYDGPSRGLFRAVERAVEIGPRP